MYVHVLKVLPFSLVRAIANVRTRRRVANKRRIIPAIADKIRAHFSKARSMGLNLPQEFIPMKIITNSWSTDGEGALFMFSFLGARPATISLAARDGAANGGHPTHIPSHSKTITLGRTCTVLKSILYAFFVLLHFSIINSLIYRKTHLSWKPLVLGAKAQTTENLLWHLI